MQVPAVVVHIGVVIGRTPETAAAGRVRSGLGVAESPQAEGPAALVPGSGLYSWKAPM